MQLISQFSLITSMEALGWAVLHSLWQGALVGLVLAFAFALLPRRYAVFRYGLAVAGLFGLLIWTALTFWLQFRTGIHMQAQEVQTVLDVAPQGLAPLPQGAGDSPWVSKALSVFTPHVGWIAVLWMLGMFAYSLRWLGSLWYLKRLRGQARQAQLSWQLRLNVLAARLRVEIGVPLLVSAQARVPMVVGYLKPAILVPAGMLTGLDPLQVEAILLHELAHIKRYDYLINLIQSFAEILFFYHPAFWWLNSRIQDEREHCCDDLAVSFTGDALSYARALTELAAMETREPHLALGLSGGRNHLLGRIQRLLTPAEPPVRAQTRLATGFVLALTLIFLAWINPISVKAQENAERATSQESIMPLPGPAPATILPYTAVDTPPPAPAPVLPPVPPAPEIQDLPPLPPMPEIPKEMPDYLDPDEFTSYMEGADWEEFEKNMKAFSVQMQQFEQTYMKEYQEKYQAYHEQMAVWQKEFMAQQEKLMQELKEEFPEEKMRALAEELARQAGENQMSEEERRRIEERLQREMERAERERERGLRESEQYLRQMEAEMRRMEAEELRRQEEVLRQQEKALKQQEAALRMQEEQLRQQAAELKELEKNAKRELVQDGFINSLNEPVEIHMTQDHMTINGKKVDDKTFQKYKKLLGQEGKLDKKSNIRFQFSE